MIVCCLVVGFTTAWSIITSFAGLERICDSLVLAGQMLMNTCF